MRKIILFSDSHKHFSESIKEYEKRLGKNIDIIQLKPSKRTNISDILTEEWEILEKTLSKIKGYKILLHMDGTLLSTEELNSYLATKEQNFSHILFVIGGAYGVDEKKYAHLFDATLSFSPLTFPHGLAYLLLLEQLYRVEMIHKNSGYHH